MQVIFMYKPKTLKALDTELKYIGEYGIHTYKEEVEINKEVYLTDQEYEKVMNNFRQEVDFLKNEIKNTIIKVVNEKTKDFIVVKVSMVNYLKTVGRPKYL